MFHGKGRDDLGFTGVGGIAGTMSFGSVHLIFNAIREIIGNQPYEFIDLGAGTGVMVMMSFAFGAVYALALIHILPFRRIKEWKSVGLIRH